MDNLAVDFEINPNNPLNAEYEINEGNGFDCSFELYAAGTVWGSIDGDINNQTDLINLLNTKIDVSSFDELSQTVTDNYNELSSNLTALTVTVGDNYTVLDGKISALSTTVDTNYQTLDNRLDTAEDSILNLTGTVNDNYTSINNRVDGIVDAFDNEIDGLSNRITTNADNITSIYNTMNNYGDIVSYDAAYFATANQGLLAESALQPNDNITLLNNNAGFITNAVNNLTNYYLKSETYTKLEVQQLIASIPQFSIEVVQSLPVTGERMVLYLVPKDGEAPDVYNEYIWVEDEEEFELLGSTAVDLDGYATEAWVQSQGYATIASLAAVATSGSYNDLLNKPTIPTDNAQLTNGAGYITGINQSDVINALGYTPYNSTNPNGYITSSALNGYATETFVNNGLATKQNTLTADNAGTGISIENGVISNTQTSAEWGNIEGDITDQTDLIELLDTKQDKLTSDNAGTDIEIVNGAGGDDTVSGNTSILLEKAVADGLNSVTVSGGLKRSLLPDGYTQYDYISVNGDCYFVTDYYPSNITEVKTKTFMHKQPTSPLVTRWTGSPTNDTFGFYMGNVSGRLTIFYGRYSDTKYLNIENVKLNMEHDIYIGVNSITFDGTSYSITRDTFTSTQPIYIGAFNQTGTTLAGMMYGRIYPVEFIEGGRTVKHYIPCRSDSGVIGLYETVTGTFISPTTGTAKKGRPTINLDTIPDDYTRIEFLQSTGTQYIDSGVIANFANNKIEQSATVQYTTSNTSRELMGTNGYGFWGKNASNKIEAALGQTTITDNALVKNAISWTTNPDGKTLTLNVNSNQYTSTASSFVNDNYAYYVFALGIRIGSGASASFLCHAKVWDYTIAVDDEVVCYLIPVKRISDNVLGMYDVVTGTFKTNAGTGTFTAGSNVALPSPTNPIPIVSNNGMLKSSTSGLYTVGKVETVTDSLNNSATAEMLLSIGDYTDTQEILSGDVTRKVGVIVLNGTENWGVYATNNGYRSFRVNNFLDADTRDGICTHLPYYNFSSSAMDRECIAIGGNKTTLYINLANEERTVDDLKAWLASQYNAGTPVIIVYPLATATTETVTGQTLTTVQGDSTLTISQASIDNLPIEANYNVQGGTVINFTGTIPTVNNATITFTQGGTTKGTITLNQSNDAIIALDAGGGGGTATDVQINGTSITSSNVANILTETAYNSSTNKIATMSDIPDVSTKQDTLVSGTNIKTINNTSLLGSGNIDTEEVFIAEYGTTTYAEVMAALQSHKIVFVIKNGYRYTYQAVSGLTNLFVRWDYSFNGSPNIDGVDTEGVYVNQNDVWYTTSNIFEFQQLLVSGTNIKTVNNTSLLGSGNIDIQSGVSMTYNSTTETLTFA